MADAEDGLRLGVEFPEDNVVGTSAGVEGGGYGPGGLSASTVGSAGEVGSNGFRKMPDAGRACPLFKLSVELTAPLLNREVGSLDAVLPRLPPSWEVLPLIGGRCGRPRSASRPMPPPFCGLPSGPLDGTERTPTTTRVTVRPSFPSSAPSSTSICSVLPFAARPPELSLLEKRKTRRKFKGVGAPGWEAF